MIHIPYRQPVAPLRNEEVAEVEVLVHEAARVQPPRGVGNGAHGAAEVVKPIGGMVACADLYENL